MKSFISRSPAETEAFAEAFAKELHAGQVVAFRGGLGMGKTCFTRGLAKGLGYEGDVTSPTFALINEYVGGRLPLYHFDMYRVGSWGDLDSTGFFDYLEAGGVLAVEWSEQIDGALGRDTIFITIEALDEMTRRITVTGGEDDASVGA
jgi:tRNA threonylcarbamoyladenosine biosynthesis protein TsaE